ncbi:hypothetical protein CHELA40_11453 [Chelatococcus asaccharovorans]|nr:hypothetical protein CHELA40_11453 [Chelatococcus asaccharovorans]CAH1684737.1 hypothetical protein CHELA17_64149 [Chelatococcus asaccharovorans]
MPELLCHRRSVVLRRAKIELDVAACDGQKADDHEAIRLSVALSHSGYRQKGRWGERSYWRRGGPAF